MLPDVDSDSGVPVRESLAFAAAIIPMLMIERFKAWGLEHDYMVLAAGGIYLFVRFGIGKLLKKYTVHRGMFHSLPAAVIFGLLAFLICQCNEPNERIYKSLAVFIGFMSHLILDEIWSIERTKLGFRFKKSSGTAMKIYGKNLWGNVSVYAKLFLVSYLVLVDSSFVHEQFHPHHGGTHASPGQIAEDVKDATTEKISAVSNFTQDQFGSSSFSNDSPFAPPSSLPKEFDFGKNQKNPLESEPPTVAERLKNWFSRE